MNRSFSWTSLGLLVVFTTWLPARDGAIQLVDGGSLKGELAGVQDGRLLWKSPYATGAISFSDESALWVRFKRARTIAAASGADYRFDFFGGGRLHGELLELTPSIVKVATRRGVTATAPRDYLRSMIRLPRDYSLLFEGPTELAGWRVSQRQNLMRRNPQSAVRQMPGWQYNNGAFTVSGPGILGLFFEFQESLRVEFDLSWSGYYTLNVGLLSSSIDQDDFRTHTTRLTFMPGNVSVQAISEQGRITQLGRVQRAELNFEDGVRVGIVLNTRDNALTLFVDGEEVKRWVTRTPFLVKGSGLVFSATRDGPTLSMRNLEVTTWNGPAIEVDLSDAQSDQDFIYLQNHDRFSGDVSNVLGDSLVVSTPAIDLSVPRDRVWMLRLKNRPGSVDLAGTARTYLHGGDRIAMNLNRWSEGIAAGASPVFGDMEVSSDLIRAIRFNTHLADRPAPVVTAEEEVIWEVVE
jgi:hypothetical protein